MSNPNASFQERVVYFQNKKKIVGADVYFECNLNIDLDCGPLGGFIRGALGNANIEIPYAYQLDVRVAFDQEQFSIDGNDVVARDGAIFCKHLLQIEQPITKVAVGRKGMVLDGTKHRRRLDAAPGEREMACVQVPIDIVRARDVNNFVTQGDDDNHNRAEFDAEEDGGADAEK